MVQRYGVFNDLQEELGVAANYGLYKSISIGRLLGNWLAESERIAAGLVGSEVKMMSGDSRYAVGQPRLFTVTMRVGREVVPPTVGPQALTASTAAAVVQCSSFNAFISSRVIDTASLA
jgi:hypothetical protein